MDVRTYLSKALGLIEQEALFSVAVDWPSVHRDAAEVLAAATTYADTHEFLTKILKEAGGRHSHLSHPRPGAGNAAPMPTGELIDQIAYLNVPRLSGGRRRIIDYIATGSDLLNEMRQQRPNGWIVDLRRNIGGNMWPMLAVVAPLLPEGILGHFELPDGRHQTWSVTRGRVKLDRKSLARTRNRLKDPNPVAVLTSKHTASAGEAVAVAFRAHAESRSFGHPTAGYTTGNTTHILKDGTRLHISGSYYADHRKNRIDGPIQTDEHSEEPRKAAQQWLLKRGQ